jgi:hypothetical protein
MRRAIVNGVSKSWSSADICYSYSSSCSRSGDTGNRSKTSSFYLRGTSESYSSAENIMSEAKSEIDEARLQTENALKMKVHMHALTF